MLRAFKPVIYIQLSSDRLTVRNVKSGALISGSPQVAIKRRGANSRIVAIGVEALGRASDPLVDLINPFGHPRSLVSDFTVGEQVLKAFMTRLRAKSFLSLSPRVVMHPLGDPVGGFTQVEARALHEMALGAGASEVMVWQGRSLTDQEILLRKFPQGGRILA